ncbi:hypothetical protein D3C73_591460 [compost metagenome]
MSEWDLVRVEAQCPEGGNAFAAAGKGKRARKRADLSGPDAEFGKRRLGRVCTCGAIGNRLQALAIGRKRLALRRVEFCRGHQSKKLEIVVLKNDRIVGRSLLRTVKPAG